MRCFLNLAVIALCTFWSAHSGADIYRSTDKDGVVHFTNVPKRGKRWRRIIRSRRQRKSQASALSRLRPVKVARGSDLAAWSPYIAEASKLYQIPVPLIRAVMRVESGYNPNVVSRTGAMGLMQLMPATAARMGVRNPFHPRENVLGGVRYLRILANMFGGDLALTLAGYNAGEHAVVKYGGIPPYDETQRYVRRVLRNFYQFKGEVAVASNDR